MPPKPVDDWHELIQPARDYYALPGNTVGGSLHIVLDDGNLDDAHVDFCMEQALRCGDGAGYALATRIRMASRTQRKKLYGAYRLYAGFEEVVGETANLLIPRRGDA